MAVSNATLEHGKDLFERKVQEDLAAKKKDESKKVKEAENAADAARQAVLEVKLQEDEIVLNMPAGGGVTKKARPNALAHQVLGLSGREDRQNENPDAPKNGRQRMRVRTRSRAREFQRERSRT